MLQKSSQIQQLVPLVPEKMAQSLKEWLKYRNEILDCELFHKYHWSIIGLSSPLPPLSLRYLTNIAGCF